MIRINIFIFSFLMACSAFFSIGACADNGNADFSVQQQFGMTFEQIKGAASQGDPDAEYALGYMFYYGKGTPRDENAAKIWIEKAASQGQPQAVKALQMLGLARNPKEGVAGSPPNPSVAGIPVTPAMDNSANAQNGPGSQNGATDNSMAATNNGNVPDANSGNGAPTNTAATDSQTSPPAAVPSTMVTATDNDDQSSDTPSKKTAVKTKSASLTGSNISKRKLLDAPPHYYTIQLLGAHHESDLTRFVKAHNLQSKTVYYRSTSFEGRPWYVLVYGIYPSDAKAEAAIKHLPSPLRKLNPWAKSVSSVKHAIHAENNH